MSETIPQSADVMAEPGPLDIDILTEFRSIDRQLLKITGIRLLLTFADDDDKKRLRELNGRTNYEPMVFRKDDFCSEFSKTLNCSDPDRLYQHTLAILAIELYRSQKRKQRK